MLICSSYLSFFWALKSLTLADFIGGIDRDKLLYLPQLISKWKNLDMGHCLAFKEVLTEIKTHCKKFIGLGCVLDYGELETIATLFPNIKYLSLKGAYIDYADLHFILSKFTELELLDIANCAVLDGNDKISGIASRFKNIKIPISLPMVWNKVFLCASSQF
ncbi:hypothetical protein AQUCO_02700239v1 [Aquilegia coerulea]|uniref:Uncharacterized protein n=1 Tax=Aquilegia coerulea TaxID=218851 RepID=A0A2G5D5V6_AQUCA|nr:hypothetical protein AQUCO_02700239v1 [Aquilegia coerulea]